MTHVTIIEQWPSIDALSADVGLKRDTVRKWKERKSIPPSVWLRVVDAAKERKLRNVTYEALLKGMP